jgi:hypothetical protein
MRIALLHKDYNESHLQEVIEEMKKLGAPTIKAVWMECYNHFAALEGCHRIRAAKKLGLIPEIEEVEYSDEEIIGDSGDVYTVSELADESYKAEIIEFDEDED